MLLNVVYVVYIFYVVCIVYVVYVVYVVVCCVFASAQSCRKVSVTFPALVLPLTSRRQIFVPNMLRHDDKLIRKINISDKINYI